MYKSYMYMLIYSAMNLKTSLFFMHTDIWWNNNIILHQLAMTSALTQTISAKDFKTVQRLKNQYLNTCVI